MHTYIRKKQFFPIKNVYKRNIKNLNQFKEIAKIVLVTKSEKKKINTHNKILNLLCCFYFGKHSSEKKEIPIYTQLIKFELS